MANQQTRHRRQTSIRDVARLAGVSLGSASRVINQAANVTPDVRARVEKAIAELGYRPNHVARSLRSRRSKTVGFMFTDVTNPLYSRVFRAVEDRLRDEQYMLLVANSLSLPERELELLDLFRSRAMDGVIISPGNEQHAGLIDMVRDLPMPTVIFDRDLDAGRDCLLIDHSPAIASLVGELATLGHRRIGLLVPRNQTRPVVRRLEGFRAGFAHHGLPVPEDLIVQLPTAMSPAFDAVSALLRRPDRPTALISLGTILLSDALNAIAAAGLRVPSDISLISVGDPDFARSNRPAISTLRIDVEHVADQLVTLLLERMQRGDDRSPRRIVVAPELIRRDSCAPAPAGPAAAAPARSRGARKTPGA